MEQSNDTTKRPDGEQNLVNRMSPFALVANRVLAEDSKLSPSQRLVALAVAKRLNGRTGVWSMSYADIANRTGLSVSTVQRSLAVLCDGPAPLFARRPSGEPVGTRRRYQFTVVINVAAFRAKRDEHRRKRRAVAGAVVGDRGSGGIRLSPAHERLRDEYESKLRELSLRAVRGELSDEGFRSERERLELHYRNVATWEPSGFRLATGTDGFPYRGQGQPN